MLEPLLGSEKKEKILLYVYTHGEAYAREMARAFGAHVNVIQHHLENLEYSGVLYSKFRGTVRLFGLNPRYPLKKELEALLSIGTRKFSSSLAAMIPQPGRKVNPLG